jgi:hypothetical protein
LALAGGAWLAAPAASASVPGPPGLFAVALEFGYVGPHMQSVTVPSGVTYAQVRVIGGHGGATNRLIPTREIEGGDGAEVSGAFPVASGQQLYLYVAGSGANSGGRGSSGGAGGWGAVSLGRAGYGGAGGSGSGLDGQSGGGGGGASSIQTSGTMVVLAGGGGGAGGPGLGELCCSGGPGGSSGVTVDAGHNGRGAGAGHGGGGGTEPTATGSNGGNGSWNGGGGGGGGAGLRGGSGGTGGGFGGGGGGGGGAGSSLYGPGLRDGHVARGTTSDGNGRIFITWLTGTGTGVGVSPGTQVTLVPYAARADAITGPASAGQPVQLQPESGSADQVWTLTSPGNPSVTEVVNEQSGLCLDATSAAAGATVTATTCTGSPTQQWAESGLTNGSYHLFDGGYATGTSRALTPEVGSSQLELEPLATGTLQDWLEQPAS